MPKITVIDIKMEFHTDEAGSILDAATSTIAGKIPGWLVRPTFMAILKLLFPLRKTGEYVTLP